MYSISPSSAICFIKETQQYQQTDCTKTVGRIIYEGMPWILYIQLILKIALSTIQPFNENFTVSQNTQNLSALRTVRCFSCCFTGTRETAHGSREMARKMHVEATCSSPHPPSGASSPQSAPQHSFCCPSSLPGEAFLQQVQLLSFVKNIFFY